MYITIQIPHSAPWLPPSLRDIPRAIRHVTAFSDPERKIFRKHKKIPVSQWCERYRYVTMSVLPGKWRNDVTPYLAGIMDASFFQTVQTVIICKAPQVGGPLALDTKIPTSTGWKTMGEICVGDVVFDESGHQCKVTSVSNIFKDRDCYEITFSDGSKMVADASHLWTVIDERNRKKPITKTMTTGEISTTYKNKEGRRIRNRYIIPVALPLQLDDAVLPVAPYVLGVWLGDGNKASNQITTHDDDAQEMSRHISESGHKCVLRKPTWCKGNASNIIIEEIGNRSYETCIRGHKLTEAGIYIAKNGGIRCQECQRQHSKHHQYGFVMDPVIRTSFYSKLQNLNVLNNKHIPLSYLRASYQQRLELLQGIMDTDGNIAKDGGHCEVSIADARLAHDIYELLMTLGIKATTSTRVCRKTGWGIIKHPRTHYRISFTAYADRPIFKLHRKLSLMIPLDRAGRPSETRRRRIVYVRPLKSAPVRCIGVDSPHQLFLAGESMIPTHNTESVLNCLGYAIDRDPGPALCIYPDEQTSRENCQDRIQPMIKTSPRLRAYMTGIDDDSSMLRISLQHMPIYMAWARSAARLANKPIRYLIFDETDKYPETAGKKETDPISLGEARTITYRHSRRIWKISTPTTETGNIWKALNTESQVIFDHWVTCPACGDHHRMEFKQIKWAHKEEPGPDGKCHSEDPETIEAEKLAWYECPKCLAEWNDYDRDRAVRDGAWRDRKTGTEIAAYLKAKRPVKIGFHIPSWISPFVPLSTVAAAFLRGLSDMNKFKDFYNKHLAEPWKLTVVSKNEEQILAARCDIPPQTVPENAVALTVGVDQQKHGFWFVVRAWAADMTSWLIHYGFLSTEEELDRLIYDTSYPVAGSGRTMKTFRALRDTGGGEKYEDMTMTEESYLWILRNRGRGGCALWGAKGSSRALPGMLSIGNEVLATPSGKKLPGALRVISVDTEKAKDQFHYRLGLASKEDTRSLPGALFLHSETGPDYAAQILAEEKQLNERGHEEWVNVHQRPNHLLDAEILAAACAEMEFPGGGLRLLAAQRKPHAGEDAEGAEKKEQPKKSYIGPRKGWFRANK